MKPFILQDWLTVRSSGRPPVPAGPYFVQDAAGWLDLSLFQDVVVWFDLRQSTQPGVGGTLTWHFETAPTKDEALFQTMALSAPFGTISTRVLSVIPITLANAISGGSVPLSTWVRWMIEPSADSPWQATFRIILAANQVTRGATRAGKSTALQSAMAAMTKLGAKKQPTAPSSVVSVSQTTGPISLGQKPNQGGATSLVQPALGVSSFGGLGGLRIGGLGGNGP